MGSVWKAEDPLLDRQVALKLLSRVHDDKSGALHRFLREARSTSVLEHPGIATLFDAGESDGEFYLAVAYVDGDTISDLVDQGLLETREALRIAADAAAALAHAHERGVVHRDVTARNIMRARDGRVVVIDFGLARREGGSSTSGGLGTVAYMAPEVLSEKRANERSDLFSLGVVLYLMLTGTLPFHGETAMAMAYAAVNEPVEPPSERFEGVPRELDALVLGMLAKKPEHRHPSALVLEGELRDAIRALENRGDSNSTPPTHPVPPRHHPKEPCLAILPFTSAGTDETPEATSFARGLSETLSMALARIPDLRIIPPHQSERQAGGEREPHVLLQNLGATLVLSGSVRRSGDRLRASYSILDTKSQTQVTAEQVDGFLADLFGFEDAMLNSLVHDLKVSQATRVRGAADPAAHERYLQALGYLQRLDNEAAIDGAIRILESLVKSEGDSAVVHAALGRAYGRRAEISYDPVSRTKAEESCKLALALDPHSPEVLNTYGRILTNTGRYDEAIETLNRALQIRKDDPDALLSLSRAHELAGNLAEAERAARRVVSLRPSHWLGHDYLGRIDFARGRYEQAVHSWKQALELTPDNALALSNLAAALFHLGRLDEAEHAYYRSVEISPSTRAYQNTGAVRFYLGKVEEAVQMFRKAVDLTPRDPVAWGNYADGLRWIPRREEESREAFDRAISLVRNSLENNPANAQDLSRLAKWLSKRGRTADAIETIGRALGMAPDDVNVHARAITVFELAGERDKALVALEKSLHMGYGHVELMLDPELASLRSHPSAVAMLENAKVQSKSTA